MVKAGKWLRSFLTGKKERIHEKVAERRNWPQLPPPPPPPPTPPPSPPPSTPKEKRRRSFSLERKRRAPKEGFAPPPFISGPESGRSAAARRASFSAIENVAAIKIQASFRSFLARKALRALKGLVKLQAVVRGFLVRKQAAATLRSMQALLTVQVRARAMRVRMIQEAQAMPWRDRNQTRMAAESRLQPFNDKERSLGGSKSRKSGPISQAETKQHRAPNYYQKSSSSLSPSPDPMAGTFNELSFVMGESSSSASTKQQHRIISSEADALQDGPCSLFPNYMANTESWKAKARSQSVPRQRNDLSDYARQCSGKQRTSIDGKNPNRAVREQIAWPIMLDRSVTIAGCNRIIAA